MVSEANASNEHGQTNTRPAFVRPIAIAIAAFLSLVVLAPVALSSQDLYRWANTTRGLNLEPGFAAIVPIALDVAAAVCIGMTVIGAVWRRERPGLFGILVWVFAGVSAYSQYKHGTDAKAAGLAQDAYWFFPIIAILGPLLLEVTLNRIRRWARQDAGEQQHGAAGFGSRWLPGVAFRETIKAWAASRREGITKWQDAVAYVREREALKGLTQVDAVRYAVDALRTNDLYSIRVWLQSRGVVVEQDAIDEAFAFVRLANIEPHSEGEHDREPNGRDEDRCSEADARERTPNTDANERPQANTPEPVRTPVETDTERAPANVRAFVRPVKRKASTGEPATDEQVAFVERAFPGVDWRTNTPSARDLSEALGKSSTTPGNNLRKALVARAAVEQASTPKTPREATP